jgi:hypothetical protein
MSASLRDLGRRGDALPPTHFDAADLMRQGETRLRRRRLAAAAIAAAVLVLAVGLAGAALSGNESAQVPAQDPTPTGLERIRAEGTPGDETVTESGITARAYVVCDGTRSECSPQTDGPIRRAHEHMALEVTQDGRSALFSMHRGDSDPSVTAFDADSVFVMDLPPNALGNPEEVRFRLLRADGTEVLLELLADPAPAVPGPGVLVIDLGWLSGDDYVQQHAFLVNQRKGTLQPLNVSWNTNLHRVGAYWGPNTDESLWFVSHIDCRVFWVAGGTVETRQPCGDGFMGDWDSGNFTNVDGDWFPDGWLRPGRMAVLEHSDDRLILHVSLDQGTTWQRIPVLDEAAIPDALQRLG